MLLGYKHLRLKSRVYGMVTHYAMKMMTTCSPIIGHLLWHQYIFVKPLKNGSLDLLKYKYWKELETTVSLPSYM